MFLAVRSEGISPSCSVSDCLSPVQKGEITCRVSIEFKFIFFKLATDIIDEEGIMFSCR
ncbi:hypothetical protein ROD_42341 [Citrobacter rodentium ICC168]|uniref:Uncharacterized protein n=1 Tax=Citrobacter rodentium (strain ICC168) TaxID=637910 RepID=D2TJT3_CITRI|nr:hypothetical protein ROD_42341 [Citrobacter rodentium ICC168]